MYIAEIYGQRVEAGTEIEIPNLGDGEYIFRVLTVRKHGFDVVWSTGDKTGMADHLPFVIFGNDVVKLIEIDEKNLTNNPNQAFLLKRLTDNVR